MTLQGRNLEKSYGNTILKTKVLKGVDIEIGDG